MDKKLTIREIAKMAGVSPTAVSFVINGKPGVGDETRKKVGEVIRRTNFRPSLNSRRLFFRKSYNISIIIQQTASPFKDLFYFGIVMGLLEKSKESGYNMVFADVSVNGGSVLLPEVIKRNDTDGIIFLQDISPAIANEINRLDIPFVVVDAHSPDCGHTCVNADYRLSARIATRHLVEMGHREIAFIGSSFVPEFYMQTFNGFKDALDESGVSIRPAWIQNSAVNETDSYRCMQRMLKSPPAPTAVFCATDMFAIGAVKCTRESGLHVPSDISFASLDDNLLSGYVEPALTTVHIDMQRMGALAMELIVRKIDGESVESVMVESDCLVRRDSVKKRN